MKLLAAMLALLLLVGCAAPGQETETAPTKVDPLHSPGHILESQTSGIIQVFPTEQTAFSRVYPMGQELLLQSGGSLVRLTGSSLTPGAKGEAQVVLRTDPDGVWLFDGVRQQVVILGSDLEELQTIALPGTVLGTPGLSEDGRFLYYLQEGRLLQLDCSSGLSRVLRDNMHFSDGSVKALGSQTRELLVQLTLEDGGSQSLLVSAQDGSTLHAELSPLDAARSEAGLQLVTADTGGQLVLLLTDGGTAAQLKLHQGEQVCCFLDSSLITSASTQDGITLRLYSFTSGILQSTVSLPGIDTVGGGCFTIDENLYITVRDAASGEWWVLRWNYDAFPPESTTSCLEPYYTREAPDTLGMRQCRERAASIGDTYGVTVLLFDEAAGAAPWDYAFTAAYRVDETQWALDNLEEALSAFPEGFLGKLNQDWDELTICLVSAIRGTAESGSLDSAEGLQFQSGSRCYIALAPSSPESLRYTLFHEFSHLIDTQVLNKCSAYDNWNDLNPQDFAYTMDYHADTSAYASLLSGENRAFVDSYAMSYPSEDRARIFECAANPGNEEMFTAPILQQKLLRICTGIRQAFGLTKDSQSFVWEQYLTMPLS